MNGHKSYQLHQTCTKQVKIRLPEEYLIRLKEIAYQNRRSFNNEIMYRLLKTLFEDKSLTTQGENNENI
jgi:hypothetical protein